MLKVSRIAGGSFSTFAKSPLQLQEENIMNDAQTALFNQPLHTHHRIRTATSPNRTDPSSGIRRRQTPS